MLAGMSCHARAVAPFSPACTRKRNNASMIASRCCSQARAISSPDVDTSLGPESGHDVEFRGQDDNGRCVPQYACIAFSSSDTLILFAGSLNHGFSS